MTATCDATDHEWRLYAGSALDVGWAVQTNDFYRCTRCGLQRDHLDRQEEGEPKDTTRDGSAADGKTAAEELYSDFPDI